MNSIETLNIGSRAANLGLVRTTTLGEGRAKWYHRFKKGREAE